MSESKAREAREQRGAPKSHQLSLVSITITGNIQAAFYSIHDSETVEKAYVTAVAEGGVFRVETGDRTDNTNSSVVLIPASQIVLLAVAKISHVVTPLIHS